MAELEERVDQLESDLTEIKTDIKELLVELKVLMAREQNPLADPDPESHSRPTRDGPIFVVAPTGV